MKRVRTRFKNIHEARIYYKFITIIIILLFMPINYLCYKLCDMHNFFPIPVIVQTVRGFNFS